MTNKILWMVGLVVVVSVFAGVNFVKSLTAPANYVIENIENWYGGNTEGVKGDEKLGAVEFNTGKVVFDELAESVLVRRQVVVSALQVDNIRNVPIILVPAPGDESVTLVESIVGFRRFSSESWSSNNTYTEGFEVKWGPGPGNASGSAGMTHQVSLGASFSLGFMTGNQFNNTTSQSVEYWRPSIASRSASATNGDTYGTYASGSPVFLTSEFNPDNNTGVSNAGIEGITDFVFEVIYRILPRP